VCNDRSACGHAFFSSFPGITKIPLGSLTYFWPSCILLLDFLIQEFWRDNLGSKIYWGFLLDELQINTDPFILGLAEEILNQRRKEEIDDPKFLGICL
jgi:hypothetical protein